MNRENIIVITLLAALTGYCLFLDNNELAGMGMGALAAALTSAIRGPSHEKTGVAAHPADHNGV